MSTDFVAAPGTTSRSRDSSRARSVRLAPSSASRRAIARPMPVPAPVTTTCLPSSRFTRASLRAQRAVATARRRDGRGGGSQLDCRAERDDDATRPSPVAAPAELVEQLLEALTELLELTRRQLEGRGRGLR